MTACSCGRPARPLAAILLATPVIVGAPAASIAMLAQGTSLARPAKWIAGAIFAALIGGLLVFALRVIGGRACAGCGRVRAES